MSEISDSRGKYVDVQRLEFVVTWQCNSSCKHCLVGEERPVRRSLDAKLAARIVSEVTDVYRPTSVMTFGGEPLLHPEVVCAVHATARDRGIPNRQIITNAGYPASESNFRRLANRLAEAGVTHAAVSVDGFHQEHIPVSTVERNVQALLDNGIGVRWNPCWVISAEHKNLWNERTWGVLDALGRLAVPAVTGSDGNVVYPAGNAMKWLRQYLPSKTLFPAGTCEDVPYAGRLDRVTSMSVDPVGSVLVCKEFAIGNANIQNVGDILRAYDPYQIPEAVAILGGGIAELERSARQKGISSDPGGYHSICGKCIDLRRKMATMGQQ